MADLGEQCILLSFFSGVEVAARSFVNLVGHPVLHLTWEIDEGCCNIIRKHFPEAKIRGDVLKEDPKSIVELIDRYDSHQTCAVVFLAAPPCPDFSVISDSAKGLQGAEGSKFTQYANLVQSIEKDLGGREVRHMVENVIFQQKSEAQYISDALGASPIVIDSADFGLIGRPRLWWTRLDWRVVKSNPLTGGALKWGKHQHYPRLIIEGHIDETDDLYCDGHVFHPKIQQHVARMPCLTTPAPDESGRAAPKKSKTRTDPETRNRWMAGGRQYAPWHYQEHALLANEAGDWVTPPITIKEQLHHLPYDYTQHPEVSDRERHRMLGNSWHMGVSMFLLLLILQSPITQALPQQVRMSRLEMVCQAALCSHIQPGPRRSDIHDFQLPFCDTMEDHWREAQQAPFPSLRPIPTSQLTEHSATFVLHHLGDVHRLRREVLEDIQELVDQWSDHTVDWWKSLPHHLQKVYWHEDTGMITQVPIIIELLERCGFPQLQQMAEDLNLGFSTVGPLHPGVGWWPRLDGRYQHPLDMDTFHQMNHSYVQHRLRQGTVDENWEAMLTELLEDRSRGRLEGPFRAPQHWETKTIGIPGEDLLEAPSGPVFAAFCFSVIQSDKIRRCEDHRRSHHNSTISVDDVPHHDSIDAYTRLALWWISRCNSPIQVWAHDMDSAYRQLGVRNTDYSYVLLQTPEGAMLFRHTALCFGSTASVWSFNRFADSLVFLMHHLLVTPCLHYVDDFGGIEPSSSAQSAFEAFAAFFRCLGLKTKEKKAEPPSPVQKLLGVIIEVESDGVRLSPCPERILRLKAEIGQALGDNKLSPEAAHRLCGKLMFLQTTCFGQMGKAPLQCIYSRAGQGASDFQRLTHALEASLRTLQTMLATLTPRCFPKSGNTSHDTLWTDAYYAPGDERPGKRTKMMKASTHLAQNGWGFVLSCESETFFSHGSVPAWAMRPFTTRRAYIYLLESIAPVIACVLMRDMVSSNILAFVDNQASLQALRKGYGRDISINGLLCFFWAFATKLNLNFAMEWVPSHLNISDPVSRHDCQTALRLGWTEVPSMVDQLYRILVKCSGDLEYAAGDAISDCLSLTPAFRQVHLVHGGVTGPEMVEKDGPVWGVSYQAETHPHHLGKSSS